MLRITLWALVGVLAWETGFCSISCPDGNVCQDTQTCCATQHGYSCCPYPKAVCCPDLAHCCPSGFQCNVAGQTCERTSQPWMNVPLMKKEAAQEPSTLDLSVTPFHELKNNPEKSSVVYCDNYHTCPDGMTCCRHPAGAWFCCPYTLGRCCLDGFHCCPYGYDCDLTYTHCVRNSLENIFMPRQALSSVPASPIKPMEETNGLQEKPMAVLTEASANTPEVGVIRCDSKFFCPNRTTCCRGTTGQWGCCPFQLGNCCKDGRHCCQYGYTCDSSSSTCMKGYAQIPARQQEEAQTY